MTDKEPTPKATATSNSEILSKIIPWAMIAAWIYMAFVVAGALTQVSDSINDFNEALNESMLEIPTCKYDT